MLTSSTSKNHFNKWCQDNCDPNEVKNLEGVNTPICEQLFKKVNQYSNCKSMNDPRFFLFWCYKFEMHNLDIEGLASSLPDPRSTYRWDNINVLEPTLEEDNLEEKEVENVIDLLKETHIANEPKFKCEKCGATYDKKGYFETHLKKHENVMKPTNSSEEYKCSICNKILQSRRNLDKHIDAHKTCKTCKAIFESNEECREHEKVHTTCMISNQDFDFPSKLTRHIKQKHK